MDAERLIHLFILPSRPVIITTGSGQRYAKVMVMMITNYSSVNGQKMATHDGIHNQSVKFKSYMIRLYPKGDADISQAFTLSQKGNVKQSGIKNDCKYLQCYMECGSTQ